MPLLHRYVPQLYRDSVTLMQFARSLQAPGIEFSSAVMATSSNLALLAESGWEVGELEVRPDDLLLSLGGDAVTAELLDHAAEALARPPRRPAGGSDGPRVAASISEAVAADPEVNWALISVPGDYAAAEALKALSCGLHVMMFSDNVTVEQEVFLKKEAATRGLLMLGPDCGTAVVQGVSLGFANRLRQGPIGLVSASGTGLQEVSSLLDRWGSGVSQALGTGGRDLKEAVGGLAMFACLDALEDDEKTTVVVVISKPPAAAVRSRLKERLATYQKPVVCCFIGELESPSLEQVARHAFRLAEGKEPEPRFDAVSLPAVHANGGRWLRAVYSGGTLCAEAAFRTGLKFPDVFSNVAVLGAQGLADVWQSQGHCLVDMGEDEFTRGRPHPMIDPSLRNQRISQEWKDPVTRAILVDVVLGFGAHDDPAGSLIETIKHLRDEPGHRDVPVFAAVVGTDRDPQNWSASVAALRRAGIVALGSNAEAVDAALAMVAEAGEKK